VEAVRFAAKKVVHYSPPRPRPHGSSSWVPPGTGGDDQRCGQSAEAGGGGGDGGPGSGARGGERGKEDDQWAGDEQFYDAAETLATAGTMPAVLRWEQNGTSVRADRGGDTSRCAHQDEEDGALLDVEETAEPTPAGAPLDDDSLVWRQASIRMADTDAAVARRAVSVAPQLKLPPDSPARAKDIAKRIRNQLLRNSARGWDAAAAGGGGLGSLEYLCSDREIIAMCKFSIARRLWASSSLVEMSTPVKVFGDIHGQFGDLMRYFATYGAPQPYGGDIEYCSYLFLGDYVDRGIHSLEVGAWAG
jgi:hypothetical protein